MTENILHRETSPYLLQHKDNPVHWRPWGDTALAEARDSGRPILLSVGYAACHWCHVMAHESFENADIAALMNDLFINIKVDREERPDIDAIYQSALAMMGEQGGWPLTMFLTPAGEPFWGGTYYPPEPRYGRPGFPDVLQSIAETYRKNPSGVRSNADALRKGLRRLEQSEPGAVPGPELQDRIAERLLQEFDPIDGGIGGAPKFPQGPTLALVWRAAQRADPTLRHNRLADAIRKTLLHICQGGIYDHLGGGMARYSVDQHWLVPHFEKMLYDNAQLVDLAVDVWKAEATTPDAQFRDLLARRIEETIGWVVSDLAADQPAFASARDADSEGVEGKFYVWTKSDVDALLGEDAALFNAVYGVTDGGNWEGVTILNRLNSLDTILAPEDEAILARCRSVLLEARAKRPPPEKDTKVLADWNGLAIHAIAKAAAAFDRSDWLESARAAFAFIQDSLAGPDGRLFHSWARGRAQHAGMLADYAAMARAAMTLHEATGDGAYLSQAATWIAVLDRHFLDADSGGYHNTADDASDLLLRLRTATDTAEPAGNGMAAETCVRLWLLTGDDTYRQRAEAVIMAFAGELQRNFFPYATLLAAADFLSDPVQLVLHEGADARAAEDLWRLARTAPLRNAVLTRLPANAELPEDHPAQAQLASRAAGSPAALFICRAGTCSLPISDPGELEEQLFQ
ncbi:MAG: thioredoxin domain-containing protein [Alphaproteobacteria bacterium]|nr:thioredoxin domain-containing protein [Alphaproteobacteria bacterium]